MAQPTPSSQLELVWPTHFMLGVTDEQIQPRIVGAAAHGLGNPARPSTGDDRRLEDHCEQYVLFTVADPRDIAMWLSGYFNSKSNNTVLDTQQFREHARQVMDYCQQNFKTP